MRRSFQAIRRLFGEQPQKKHTGPRLSHEARLATWWWSASPAPSSIVLNPDWFPAPQKQKSNRRKRKWGTKGKKKDRKRGTPQGGCSDRRRTGRLALSKAYQRKKALAAAPVFVPKKLDRGSPAQGPSTSTTYASAPVPLFKGERDPILMRPTSVVRDSCCHACGERLYYGWHVDLAKPELSMKHVLPGTFVVGVYIDTRINRKWWQRWKDYTPPT